MYSAQLVRYEKIFKRLKRSRFFLCIFQHNDPISHVRIITPVHIFTPVSEPVVLNIANWLTHTLLYFFYVFRVNIDLMF